MYEDLFPQEKSYFPRASPERNLFFLGNKSSYSLNINAINVLLYQATYDYTKYVDF